MWWRFWVKVPVGLIFTMMAARDGVHIVATDTFETRRKLARKFGAHEAFDPRDAAFESAIKEMTDGRGADVVIIAASAKGIVEQAVAISRPGAAHFAICANFASGANRSFRRRHLYGRTDAVRLL